MATDNLHNEKPTAAISTFQFSPTVRINFQVDGDPSRPPMVLLHGFGASLRTWDEIRPFLRSSYHLYLLDLKGFGLSSRSPDDRYSLSDQAEIVRAFLSEKALHGVTLVGHSYGGAVALLVAADHVADEDAALQRLVLLDSPIDPTSLPFFVRLLRVPILNYFIMIAVPATLRAFVTLRMLIKDTRKVTCERIQRYATFFRIPGTARSFIRAAEQVRPQDAHSLIERVRSVTCPVLLIWGASDRIVSVAQAHTLKSMFSRSTLVLIPSCGHIPAEESPAVTAAEILSWTGRR